MTQILTQLLLAFFISTSFLSATADGPDYFAVRDVAYNDVLWMHTRPDYRSKRIQGIPANVSCIKNFGCSHRWCKVSYKGIIGWVNGRYLGEGGCPSKPY